MDVKLPIVGDSAEPGTIVSVLVQVGDVIQAGQTVLELEQGKAIAPVAASAAGKVTAVLVKEGQKIAPGAVILSVEGSGAAASAPAPAAPSKPAKAQARPTASDDDDDEFVPEAAGEDGPVPPASPYVRKVARDLGIALSRVRGSGTGGKVTIEDLGRHIARLERAVSRAGKYAEEPKGLHFAPVNQDFGVFGPVTSEPMSPLRKIIASRMVENSVTIAHVTQFDDADLSAVEALRARHKAAYEKAGFKLTPTLFVIRALVRTLQKHGRFNASVNDTTETVVLKQHYHIGIAVDTEAGLLVPVIRDVDKKSMAQLARELADIAVRARERKISPDEMKGGTFTISNQGAIGGGHFTPIVNKPEVAILGVGKTSLKPVVTKEGKIEARPLMPLALSYDHRIIDGGSAARFITDLVQAIQEYPEADVKL